MQLKIFNSLTKTKEAILPHHGDSILMYTCGPTIYNFAHIGNFRTYVMQDLLRRAILYFGMKVKQAMNLTDVDDKTIKGAIEQNISLKEFTEPFGKAFFEDLQTLNIQPAEYYPKATDYIPEMIRIIEELLKKKIAYKSENGSIYFAIRQFPTYGKLSHLCLHDLQFNASGDNIADEYEKQNASDFVLWKTYDPTRDGNIYWESPFGKGRPGWHIECSAMSMKLLGETIDLHCGGVDLTFPHHENEIAQSEGCSGKKFVYHWFHVEHLLVDHKKMSKSLKNFYTLRDLLNLGFSGQEVRYLLLSSHYRMQLNFTFASLNAAKASLERIKTLVARLQDIHTDAKNSHHVIDLLQKAGTQFQEALADDLNMPIAMATLFDLIRDLNSLADQQALGQYDAKEALKLLQKWDQVLGVLPLEEQEEQVPEELVQMLHIREEARKAKHFAKSDEMRNEILKQGYLIEDTPSGVRLKRKS